MSAARSHHLELASGVRLRVLSRGPAEPVRLPWLLVHGLASNAHLWDGVAHQLAEAGHPVAALDQRGHGQSSRPEGPYDMATVADDLAMVLDALQWPRVAVAGQSWGGNVVIEFAHRHPNRVELVCPVDGGFIELADRFARWEDCAEALAPPRLAGTPAADLEAWIRSNHRDWPESGIRGTLANFEVLADGTVRPWLSLDRHLAVLRGLWEHRPSERFPTLSAPAMFIVADSGDVAWTRSKETAVSRARELTPRARVAWFRPAHHDVHAQHPRAVARLLMAATEPDFFATKEDIDP